jgi:hypothetical protein
VPNLIQLQLVIRNQRKLKKKLLLDVKNWLNKRMLLNKL